MTKLGRAWSDGSPQELLPVGDRAGPNNLHFTSSTCQRQAATASAEQQPHSSPP